MSDYDDSDAPSKPKRQPRRPKATADSAEQSTNQDAPADTSRPRTNSRSNPRSGHKSGTTRSRDGDSGRTNTSRSSSSNRSDGPRREGDRSEGDRKPYQRRSGSDSGNRSEGDRPQRRNTGTRTEGYRPVNSGARRNSGDSDNRSSDRSDGNRSDGNRRPYQRRSSDTVDRNDGGQGYRPVNSGARRNTNEDTDRSQGGNRSDGNRSEGNRRPYQNRSDNNSGGDRPRRNTSNRTEGYRPVNSGARRNTNEQETDRPQGGNRRPYQNRSENTGGSGDRPPRRDYERRSDSRGDSRPSSGQNGARRGPRRGDYKEYDPATAPSKKGARTGWDAVASWYDGWVGKDGSKHHQQLAIPATMELLQLKEDEKLLDIGAGQGVLATYVTQVGAEYTGVDVSPRLLDLAQKHHGMYGRFIQADACKLQQSSEIQEGGYDAAVFLLSLQDINPLQDALQSAAWAVKPGGRIVLLMTHPCFRIPRQSGWGYDEGRKLTYRRVDHYMTPLNVPMKSYLGGSGVTISFHRPLHEYVNGLAEAGLVIDQMREITSYKAEENAAESEIPVFMALRARKLE